MTIESALFSYLSTKAAVTGQVGTRIYPQIAPESAAHPFLTYTIISTDHTHDTSGATGLANVNMQIDVWADTQLERTTISEVIRDVLDGFTGDMGTENLNIRSCFLDSRSNFQEADTEGKSKPTFRASMDFSIWHVESVPAL